MKFVIFFVIISISPLYAQNIIQGRVFSENNLPIGDVMIINIQSKVIISSDKEGNFKIEAKTNDELRFMKENYERGSKIIYDNDFSTLMSIQLVRVPIEIEQVNVAPKPTGDLRTDSKNYNPSEKVVALKNDIREYVKKPMTVIQPKNSIPSSFAPRDPYAGQLNLLSISIGGASGGIIGLLLNEGIKKNKIKPNFSEIQNFHKKVKKAFYGDYYIKQGLNESDFDAYIVYLDNKYKFSENYFINFDLLKIEKILKYSLKEFVK